ncbi:hypothetical protein [Microbispora sp. NPDC049125]|uniref:hypothetical protein n=1 Tax=Microbispora sp. NPDC049125 TaxID=3154929 RepID=UPI003465B5CC
MSLPDINMIGEAEIRVFAPDPNEGDRSEMYVIEVYGVTVNIYRRKDGGTYVGVEDTGILYKHRPLIAEVANTGENTYGDIPSRYDCPLCGAENTTITVLLALGDASGTIVTDCCETAVTIADDTLMIAPRAGE